MAVNAVDLYSASPAQMQPQGDDDFERRRREARARMAAAMQLRPIQHWTQGLHQLADTGLAAYDEYKAGKDAKAHKAEMADVLAQMYGGGRGGSGGAATPLGGSTGPGIPAAVAKQDTSSQPGMSLGSPLPPSQPAPIPADIMQNFGGSERYKPQELPQTSVLDPGMQAPPQQQAAAPAMPNPLSNFNDAGQWQGAQPQQAQAAPPPQQEPITSPPALMQRGMMAGAAPSMEGSVVSPGAPPPQPQMAQSGPGPDYRGQGGPAAVRYNNPGAQYPGPSAQKFGSTGTETIGGGHKIAVFPDAVSGGAATFDLLDRKYANQPLSAALTKWSGGNSSPAYVASVAKEMGISPDTVITPEMIRNPATAVPLAKAMARVEAGKPYPMSDDDWRASHGKAFAVGAPSQAVSAEAPQPKGMMAGPAPVQMAQSDGAMTPELFKRLALSNPALAQQMLMADIQQRQKAPDQALDREHKQLSNKVLQKSLEEGKAPQIMQTATGKIVSADSRTGAVKELYDGGQKLTSTDKKAVYEAQDELPSLDNTIQSLRRAKELVPEVYSGFGAGVQGFVGGKILGTETGKKAGEFDQIMSMEAIQSMSKNLKGATTDKEMKEFQRIISDPSQSVQVKEAAIDRLLRQAESARKVKIDRITEMGGKVPGHEDARQPKNDGRLEPGEYKWDPAGGVSR